MREKKWKKKTTHSHAHTTATVTNETFSLNDEYHYRIFCSTNGNCQHFNAFGMDGTNGNKHMSFDALLTGTGTGNAIKSNTYISSETKLLAKKKPHSARVYFSSMYLKLVSHLSNTFIHSFHLTFHIQYWISIGLCGFPIILKWTTSILIYQPFFSISLKPLHVESNISIRKSIENWSDSPKKTKTLRIESKMTND